MKTKPRYNQLKNYYYQGKYLDFIRNYNKIQKYTAQESFLAIFVFNELRDWQSIKNTLERLKKSSMNSVKIKVKLLESLFSLVNKKAGKKEWDAIFNMCDGIINTSNTTDLSFYAQYIKIKGQLSLINLGLLDAGHKTIIISRCYELYETFKNTEIDDIDLLSLLETGINYSSRIPKPNYKWAYQKLQKYISDKNSKLLPNSISIREIELKLKIDFFKREQLTSNQLPDFIISKLDFKEPLSSSPFQDLIYTSYGLHLLELECIEGITWLKKGIIGIWHFGHYKQAINNKDITENWLKDRGHTDMLESFKRETSHIIKNNYLPLEIEIEKLYKSHLYFTKGDYHTGEKLLREQLNSTSNEAIKVYYINLMVNSASKLSYDNKKQLLLIDNTLEQLNYLEKSPLIAQLYLFKAILGQSVVFFDKALAMFDELGMNEETINQHINLFSTTSNSYRTKEIAIPQKLWNTLKIINTYLVSDIWIKNRFTLLGKVWQVVAQEQAYNNNFTDAYNNLLKASDYFLKSNHLIFYSNNLYLLSISLMGLGKQHKDVNYYVEARKSIKSGLKLLYDNKLYDFIWRLEYGVALSYYEPIVIGLINNEEKVVYQKDALEYFNLTLNTIGIIIDNTLSQVNSKVLESLISLKREMRQLIFSGFYLHFYNQNWIQCILWLEKTRTKSLVSAMSKNTRPNKAIKNHKLIKKENNIKDLIKISIGVENRKDLLEKLKKIYNEMLLEQTVKDYARKKLAFIPEYDEFIKSIKNDETLLNGKKLFFIYYYTHLDNIYAFSISSSNRTPKFCKLPILASKLNTEYYRDFLFELTIAKATKKNSHNLEKFDSLVKPIKTWTRPDDIICIIPYGVLQNFPFHILHIDKKPLIYRNPIFYNSSLTSWSYIKSDSLSKNALLNPYVFGKPAQDLKESKREVFTVAKTLNCHPFIEKEVSKSSFIEGLSKGTLVHFAGHGSYDRSKGFLSAIQLHNNEILTASEIINFDTIPELVVLSACDTALQKNHDGEEQAGLIPAFLSAGTKSIIAGMWPVIDKDAKDFFSLFYKKLNDGLPKVIAYQNTVKELMTRQNRKNFYNWGMFALIGDWK